MTETHEGYHAFTAPTWLVAKEPDHLTTCNTVESERVRCLLKKSTMQKTTEILHESDCRAKKHRTQHLLYSRVGVFISHWSAESAGVEMTGPEWMHYGILNLYKTISRHADWMSCQCQLKRAWDCYLGLWIRNHVHGQRQKYILHVVLVNPIGNLGVNMFSIMFPFK